MTNRDLPPLDQMPDDFPLTLREACTAFFRGKVKPGSLRAARDRGALVIRRAGRADWVTAGGMRAFLRTPHVPPKPESLSLDADRGLIAQAALRETLEKQKATLRRRPLSDEQRAEAALESARLVVRELKAGLRKRP